MRLDRLLTLLAYRALGSSEEARAVSRLPVLMYHSVSDVSEERSPYYRLVTRPAVFAKQVRLLYSEGYTGLTLSQGLKAIRCPNLGSSRRPVVITFDDGFRDFLTDAVPLLAKYGFGATMFLPTGFIGRCRRQFMGNECLTWSEVAHLHTAGFEFGSHTVTHPRLVDLKPDDIRKEVVESKDTIEQALSVEVTAFS